jgi:predicted GH43/DUF377 family glycosyl hydrolase
MAILRVEMKDGLTHMFLAESADGVKFRVLREVLVPEEEPWLTYEGAWYDPRITQIGDTYYVAYCIENDWGVQCSLARTKDFQSFEKVSLLTEPNNRNVVLFPEKIGGLYWRLDRPFTTDAQRSHMWLASSPDLLYWGNYHFVMAARPFNWDGWKIGAGAPPIRTEEGWLEIYHGVKHTAGGMVYRLGVVLLDLEEPWKVIRRPQAYIMAPRELYERVGDVPNVCFINAAIPEKDGTVKMYYGGADTVLCLATAKLTDLVDFALKY